MGDLAFDRAMSDMEDDRRCTIFRGHDTHDSDFVGDHVKWHVSKVHGRRFDAGFRSQANRAYARQNNFLTMTTIPFLAPITPLSVEYLFEVAICDQPTVDVVHVDGFGRERVHLVAEFSCPV